jgi:hypothetical protein
VRSSAFKHTTLGSLPLLQWIVHLTLRTSSCHTGYHRVLRASPYVYCSEDSNRGPKVHCFQCLSQHRGVDHTTPQMTSAAQLSMAARLDSALAEGAAMVCPITGECSDIERLWPRPTSAADTPLPKHLSHELRPHIINFSKTTSRVCVHCQCHHLFILLGSPDCRAWLLP